MKPADDMDDVKRAYHAAAGDAAPPAALDDAIRAAARRAVQARPQPVGQGWIGRWRTPLSAAAVMVLAVSVVFVAIEEQPDVAPPALREAAAVRSTPAAQDSAASNLAERATAAEKIVVAPDPRVAPVPAAPPTAPREQPPVFASGPATDTATGSESPRSSQAGQVASGRRADTRVKEKQVTAATEARGDLPPVMAQVAPAPAPAPVAPAIAPPPVAAAGRVPAPAAPPAPVISTKPAEAIARQEAAPAIAVSGALADQAAKAEIASRDAAPSRAREAAAPAAAAAIAPSAIMQKSLIEPKESAEAWIKRMEQLLKDGKLKETREELVRFRKAYPQAVLPPELARLPAG